MPARPFSPLRRKPSPLRAAVRAFAACRRAVAALEFAILAPFLLAATLGLYDLATAFITWRRITVATQSIVEIATASAANADNTNSLTEEQAWTASTALFALLPQLRSEPPTAYSVVVSAVVFRPKDKQCARRCSYVANTAWSRTVQGVGPQRSCGQLADAPNGADPGPTTLPIDVFGPASLLVVDVTYSFRPLFSGLVWGDLRISRAAYFPPRTGSTGNWIRYAASADAAVRCPGYRPGDVGSEVKAGSGSDD